jgi:hypothetical protein
MLRRGKKRFDLNFGDESLHEGRIVLAQGEAGIPEHHQDEVNILGLEAVGQPAQQVEDQLSAHDPEVVEVGEQQRQVLQNLPLLVEKVGGAVGAAEQLHHLLKHVGSNLK